MTGISKSFPGVRALDSVDFEVGVRVDDQLELTAVVTRESAEQLALAIGAIDEPDEVIDMDDALETPASPAPPATANASRSVLAPGEVRSELLAIRALLIL